ncbi:hypothetical protein J4419_00820 [Candidatus Woesearchaeota archaeon]|nr:hypothetical protein [Candidatus Woesearchaeota archaeon]
MRDALLGILVVALLIAACAQQAQVRAPNPAQQSETTDGNPMAAPDSAPPVDTAPAASPLAQERTLDSDDDVFRAIDDAMAES